MRRAITARRFFYFFVKYRIATDGQILKIRAKNMKRRPEGFQNSSDFLLVTANSSG